MWTKRHISKPSNILIMSHFSNHISSRIWSLETLRSHLSQILNKSSHVDSDELMPFEAAQFREALAYHQGLAAVTALIILSVRILGGTPGNVMVVYWRYPLFICVLGVIILGRHCIHKCCNPVNGRRYGLALFTVGVSFFWLTFSLISTTLLDNMLDWGDNLGDIVESQLPAMLQQAAMMRNMVGATMTWVMVLVYITTAIPTWLALLLHLMSCGAMIQNNIAALSLMEGAYLQSSAFGILHVSLTTALGLMAFLWMNNRNRTAYERLELMRTLGKSGER